MFDMPTRSRSASPASSSKMQPKTWRRTYADGGSSRTTPFVPNEFSERSAQSRLARSITNGSHPIWPSADARFRLGCFASVPENAKSITECMLFWNCNVDVTMKGASGCVCGIFDDEPMWRHSTVSVSAHARKNGSHAPEYTDGRPREYGFSGKVTA